MTPVPRQQLVDLTYGMAGDASQDIDVVHLGGLVEGASTKWPKLQLDDYAERTAKTVSAWSGMNGLQGGNPAKLAATTVKTVRIRRFAPPLHCRC